MHHKNCDHAVIQKKMIIILLHDVKIFYDLIVTTFKSFKHGLRHDLRALRSLLSRSQIRGNFFENFLSFVDKPKVSIPII